MLDLGRARWSLGRAATGCLDLGQCRRTPALWRTSGTAAKANVRTLRFEMNEFED